jgi:hypothetical protein
MFLIELSNNQGKQAHALDEVDSGKGQDFLSQRDGNVECNLEDGSNILGDKNAALRSIWFETA